MPERIVATSKRRKTSTSRVPKRERIELRVTPSAKQLINRAMAVTGLTAGDLACEGARRVLDDHGCMVLTGNDRDAFLAAIANPPEPSKKLVAALKQAQGRVRAGKTIDYDPKTFKRRLVGIYRGAKR
jgi:uncharacterized protein (DUF1778 family)